MLLYKSMVCPHLEYCMQFWSSQLKKDILEMEEVQRRATKMIKVKEQLPQEDTLKRLGLFRLGEKKERTKEALTKSCKIMNGTEKINKEMLFTPSCNTKTKTFKQKVGLKQRYFFTQHTVNLQNLLPCMYIVCCDGQKLKLSQHKKYQISS